MTTRDSKCTTSLPPGAPVALDFFGDQENIDGTRVKWSLENKRGIKMNAKDVEDVIHELAVAEYCRLSDAGLIDLYKEYNFDLWIEGSGKIYVEEQKKLLSR